VFATTAVQRRACDIWRRYCTECIFEDARAAASADTYRDQRMYMREVIEDVLNGRGLEDKTFFVSRTWFVSNYRFPMFIFW